MPSNTWIFAIAKAAAVAVLAAGGNAARIAGRKVFAKSKAVPV